MTLELTTFFETLAHRAQMRYMFEAGTGWWKQQSIFSEVRGDIRLMEVVYREARLRFR
jgi:hypothetical protein